MKESWCQNCYEVMYVTYAVKSSIKFMFRACSAGGIPGLVLCLGTKVAKEALKVLATLLLHADLPAEQVDATGAHASYAAIVPSFEARNETA